MFVHICLCVCHVCALIMEIIVLEALFLIWMYTFRISKSNSYIGVTGAKNVIQGWLEVTKYTHWWVVRLRLKGFVVYCCSCRQCQHWKLSCSGSWRPISFCLATLTMLPPRYETYGRMWHRLWYPELTLFDVLFLFEKHLFMAAL